MLKIAVIWDSDEQADSLLTKNSKVQPLYKSYTPSDLVPRPRLEGNI